MVVAGSLDQSTSTPVGIAGDPRGAGEQLARFAEQKIPADDAILMPPSEDLFYYTTGRQPHVPVLMFDRTVNPYTPDEVLRIGRDLQVRW